jgi:uncharacterized surface protein with fasciclin (FAS1) repeats
MPSRVARRLLPPLTAMALLVGGCTGETLDEPGAPALQPDGTQTEPAEEEGDDDGEDGEPAAVAATEAEAAAADGDADALDVPCELDLAPEGPGSLEGMREDPVGAAIANNPDLRLFAELLAEAGMLEELDDTSAGGFTVLAPANTAFEALEDDELEELLADDERLRATVRGHIGEEALSAAAMVELGGVSTLQGGELDVASADAQEVLVDGARIICADMATANGVVHAVDRLLDVSR